MARKLAPGSFHGNKIRGYEVAGFHLSEYTYPPGYICPEHCHESAFLNVSLQGGHTELYGAGSRDCGPLVLRFHPAGEVHGNQFHDTGGRVFGLEFACQRVEHARDHGLSLDRPVELPGGRPVWLVCRLYEEFRRMDDVSPLAIEGIALELMAEVVRRPALPGEQCPPCWLRQARELLHARFAQRLSLDEIARAAGVHPDTLTRAFRRHYGCSMGDYIRELRVEFACRQMATSEMPLVEIALAAGFVDQSHFTRTFKARIGLTPAEFQRQLRPYLRDATEELPDTRQDGGDAVG